MKKFAQKFDGLQEITNPCERLRFCIEFYQNVFPHFELDIRYQDFARKLEVFFDAAVGEKKHLTLIMRLDRWIEDAVRKFRLRTTINARAATRKVDWQPFTQILWRSLPFLPPPKKQRRRKR